MTCYSSALSTVAYAPSNAAVRLLSLNNRHRSATSKTVHLVRHAEGSHNLSEEDSKLPAHFDATLTAKGVKQCNLLAQHTRNLDVEAVLVSPLTRCLETARLSFPHLYAKESNNCNQHVPFIAHEEWRETVNYLCDCRSPTQVLEKNYPRVNFDHITHENDPIWSHYEDIYGTSTVHTSMRESGDANSLYNRAHLAWKVLLSRPERQLALVGHSAFFMHMFTPLFEELEGVVQYEDDDVRELMTGGRFDNCELRSVVVDVPI
ncbi:hypothetical protein ACHAXR_004494 [Thalassiosira sp. AJA248-18]